MNNPEYENWHNEFSIRDVTTCLLLKSKNSLSLCHSSPLIVSCKFQCFYCDPMTLILWPQNQNPLVARCFAVTHSAQKFPPNDLHQRRASHFSEQKKNMQNCQQFSGHLTRFSKCIGNRDLNTNLKKFTQMVITCRVATFESVRNFLTISRQLFFPDNLLANLLPPSPNQRGVTKLLEHPKSDHIVNL